MSQIDEPPPPASDPPVPPPAGMKFLYGDFYEDGAGHLYVVWPDGTVIPTGLQEGMTMRKASGLYRLQGGKWVLVEAAKDEQPPGTPAPAAEPKQAPM